MTGDITNKTISPRIGVFFVGRPYKLVSPTTLNMNADTTEAAAQNSSVNSATVKLPPFSRSEAQTWFRRAETQFRLKSITRSTTKADHVLSSLPEDVFPQIAQWLNEQPDELTYENLKAYLLQEFTLKPAARAQKVLAMASQPLGDLSAQQAWYEIQALLTLPANPNDPATKPKKVDLEREIWLQRLPEGIRAAMPGAEEMKMSELITWADALITSGKAAARPQRPMLSEIQNEDVNAVTNTRREHTRNWRNSDHHKKKYGFITRSGICNHHMKWGEAARSCVAGCEWSKNWKSGR